MRIYFIFNIHAGKGMVKRNLSDIIDIMCMAGHGVSVQSTRFPGDAIECVRNLPVGMFDRVVCAGGDGTLDEVVSGMALREEKLPIGYIPAGSTNDFANSLGIPKNMKQAAKIAIGDNLFNCDVGRFNDKSFVYVAAFGMFTEVTYETPQDMKNVLGHSAYVLEAVKQLQEIKSYHMKVYAEGFTLEKDFLFGMITNSSSVGGIKNITGKNVDLSDGLFEVTLVEKPENPFELNATIAAFLNRDIRAKGLYSFKTGKIEFMSDDDVQWTLDGEYGGNGYRFEIENKAGSLLIAVP